MEILCDLCCFSTSCLSDNDENIVVDTGLNELFFVEENWQILFLLPNAKVAAPKVFSWF